MHKDTQAFLVGLGDQVGGGQGPTPAGPIFIELDFEELQPGEWTGEELGILASLFDPESTKKKRLRFRMSANPPCVRTSVYPTIGVVTGTEGIRSAIQSSLKEESHSEIVWSAKSSR